MTILDTHAWLWWVGDPARLGRAGRRAIDQASALGIPAVCCLEVAALAARGRVELDRPVLEWLHAALALPRVALLPLTPAVAVTAANLPSSFPGDPADRLITASAIIEAATLVTKDQRIRGFADVSTVW